MSPLMIAAMVLLGCMVLALFTAVFIILWIIMPLFIIEVKTVIAERRNK